MDKLTDQALDYILRHYKKDNDGNAIDQGRIVITGFSYGGVLAMHLSRRLEKLGINVNLLVLLDPAASKFWSGEVDRTIPCNLLDVKNVYQTSQDNTVGSYGAPVQRPNVSQTDGIQNIKVTFNHEEVDNELKDEVINWVLQFLKKQS